MATPAGRTSFKCRNCGVRLLRASKYCHACGQATRERLPSLRGLYAEYAHNYVGMEGALWRTLLRLFLLPGSLTVEYLRGRRRRYLLPLRLFLTISVLFFVVIGFQTRNTGESATLVKALQEKSGPVTVLDFGAAYARIETNGDFICDLPEWVCKRLKSRYAVEPARLAVELEHVQRRFFAYASWGMFAAMPVFALLLMLAYRNRKMFYAEHLIMALHLHSFWFVALLAFYPAKYAPEWVGIGLTAWIAAYGILAMRRVYGGGWFATLARVALITPPYLVSLAAVAVAVALVAALT
jgi:hypothetical protein